MNKRLEELKIKIKRHQQINLARNLILLPSIPMELDNLQKYIINSHIDIEKLMAEMIRVKLWAIVYDKNNSLQATRLLAALYQVVDYLPYKEKNRILVHLEPSFKVLSNRINKLTKIRNIFAHTELRELVSEFNVESTNGAQKILDTYELVEKLVDDIIKVGLNVKDYQTYSSFIMGLEVEAKKKIKTS